MAETGPAEGLSQWTVAEWGICLEPSEADRDTEKQEMTLSPDLRCEKKSKIAGRREWLVPCKCWTLSPDSRAHRGISLEEGHAHPKQCEISSRDT